MKINPLGIAAYGGLDPRNANRTQNSNQNQNSVQSNQNSNDTVKLASESQGANSKVAIKVGGPFAEFISPEEKQALELLFSRYAERTGDKANYARTGDQVKAAPVGKSVDYRV